MRNSIRFSEMAPAISRRGFGAALAGALGYANTPVSAAPVQGPFRFAVIADTHVIDSFYKGPESNALDTKTIFEANARLARVRSFINGLKPAIEAVFVAGDVFHNYPSEDIQFYSANRTRLDIAKELFERFHAKVHPGFGNHDYGVPRVSREMSHRLFAEKFGVKPYYSVTYGGLRFVHLSNFEGDTWDPASKNFSRGTGSFGEAQLNWFEAELRRGQPTFVFFHYPLMNVKDVEVRDYGLHPLLKKYKGTIRAVISGHWHKWFDLGYNFGPRHYTIGSTRYDENAYLLVEADRTSGAYRILNERCIDWATYRSEPHKG